MDIVTATTNSTDNCKVRVLGSVPVLFPRVVNPDFSSCSGYEQIKVLYYKIQVVFVKEKKFVDKLRYQSQFNACLWFLLFLPIECDFRIPVVC
jgi:hypothetical protein